jgi:hypothetical protein
MYRKNLTNIFIAAIIDLAAVYRTYKSSMLKLIIVFTLLIKVLLI